MSDRREREGQGCEDDADEEQREGTNLMILETHIPEQSVVLPDPLGQFDQSRLILVHLVAGDEALVELDDLAESEVLSRRTVQPASRLDQL